MTLAEFHRNLPPEARAQELETTQHLHDAVLGSLATVLSHLNDEVGTSDLGVIVNWVHKLLNEHMFHLCKREQEGHVRECHGDLQARNIVRWRGRLLPYDSLEFDPERRWADTMSDPAYLFMDLVSHRRSDLAFEFLNAYLSQGGDYDGVPLLRFFSVYRALLRAMVDLRVVNGGVDRDARLERARLHLSTAMLFANMAPPGLIIMHGLSGSGKSWVSARLAEQLGAIIVHADIEHQRLQAESGGVDIRAVDFDPPTYARLFSCAKSCLAGGMTVIVDAAFLETSHRHQIREWARAHDIPFLIVSCQAAVSELRARIERRRQVRVDPFDVDLTMLRRQLEARVPPALDEEPDVTEIDTTSNYAVSEALRRVRAWLDGSPVITAPDS